MHWASLMRANQESFRASEINTQNWDARIQTALNQSEPGRWDDEALPSMAEQYAQTCGGQAFQHGEHIEGVGDIGR